jgi:hypothetical protein
MPSSQLLSLAKSECVYEGFRSIPESEILSAELLTPQEKESSSRDLHLSGYQISRHIIPLLEELGFVRDKFYGNTRCDAQAYHATYQGHQSGIKSVYESVVAILKTDPNFEGDLELEQRSGVNLKYIKTTDGTIVELNPLQTHLLEAGEYKCGDIHVAINLENTSKEALEAFDKMGLCSFDREKEVGDRYQVHRIYTATFKSAESGIQLLRFVTYWLRTLPNADIKIRLEMIEKAHRQPEDARCLPCIDSDVINRWIMESAPKIIAASERERQIRGLNNSFGPVFDRMHKVMNWFDAGNIRRAMGDDCITADTSKFYYTDPNGKVVTYYYTDDRGAVKNPALLNPKYF